MRDAPRLLVPHPLHEGAAIPLSPGQAHYLLSVLRLPPGAALRLFNGRDGEWSARLVTIGPATRTTAARAPVPALAAPGPTDPATPEPEAHARHHPGGRDAGQHAPDRPDRFHPQPRPARGAAQAWAELQSRLRPQAPEPDLWLLFAPLKRDATDLLVQKATELGVSALLPVLTERTNTPRLNLARLEAIAAEAAEQCERLTLPVLHPLRPLAEVLADWPPGRPLTCAMERTAAPPIRPRAAASSAHPGSKPASPLPTPPLQCRTEPVSQSPAPLPHPETGHAIPPPALPLHCASDPAITPSAPPPGPGADHATPPPTSLLQSGAAPATLPLAPPLQSGAEPAFPPLHPGTGLVTPSPAPPTGRQPAAGPDAAPAGSKSGTGPATPPAALLVGPEGGFTPRELDALRRRPFVLPVTLGPRILRAETAAIVGLALLQASLAPAAGRDADGPDPTC